MCHNPVPEVKQIIIAGTRNTQLWNPQSRFTWNQEFKILESGIHFWNKENCQITDFWQKSEIQCFGFNLEFGISMDGN